MILSILISAAFLIMYYAIIASAFYFGGAKSIIKSIQKDRLCVITIIIVAILSVFGVSYLISLDRYIYYWDYAGYWENCIIQTDLMFCDPIGALQQLFYSINTDDYNILLPTICSLPQKISTFILGGSRGQYIITNHVIFLIPAFFAQALAATKLLELIFPNSKIALSRKFCISFIISTLFPASYLPMLHGYIDVGILCPLAAAVFLLLDYDLTVDFKLRMKIRDILFAAVLLLAWLSRRYVAFFILGIIAAMIVRGIVQIYSEKNTPMPSNNKSVSKGKSNRSSQSHTTDQAAISRGRKVRLRNALGHFLYIGVISLVVLIVFFHRFVLHTISTNYVEAYSAYDAQFITKLLAIETAFGIIAVLGIFMTIIYSIYTKCGMQQFAVLLTLLFVTSLSFFTVQSMGEHHRYIISIPIFLFITIAVYMFLEKLVILPFRTLSVACSALYICTFINAFIAPARQILPVSNYVFGDIYTPLQRNDIETLFEIRNYLNDKTETSNQSIYVLASSDILNDDIIRRLDLPNKLYSLPTLLPSSHVDLRDGFPTSFLKADIIITTNPIQTHLTQGSQEIIRYLAEEIQKPESSIGQHFSKENIEYTLDNGVKVYIYDRISNWTEEDVQSIREYYDNIYPQYKNLFLDRIVLPQ